MTPPYGATADASHPVIRVFGSTSVDGLNGPANIGGPRQRRLLALLAIRSDSVADIDWLAEYLWDDGERPQDRAPPLRTYVSRLRAAFPEDARDWIVTEPGGYRLAAPPETLEHRRFTMLREQARGARDRGDPQKALILLDEALALWRGAPFRELEDLDWARAEVAQLELDRLEMLEERWEVTLALGRHTQITGELAAFTAQHALRDRAARQHALALHRSGRTAEALRVLDDHRRALAAQTGLEPSPAILELEAALLAGDPSLDLESVGRPLRGYRLLEEIGTGAFAVVWRGVQPSVNREVAVKQIRSELASNPEFIRRFEAEAHLVARIEHPHIVPLIDYWRDPDSAYLVMRWLRGGTLERMLDDGPLSVDQTLALGRQVGGALAAAHARGVIHRDVKPSNILWDDAGNAFLADFGIALEAAKSSGPEAALSPGSPAYASPEQIRHELLGPEADVFSLGVVLFECLAGALPFPAGSSARDLIDLQLNEPHPPLSDVRADVPPSVSDAIARATAKDAEERFGSMAEFLFALDPAATGPSHDVAAVETGELTNPYKGLRAFEEGDSKDFFGRERLVHELVGRFAASGVSSRCLVIVGPSGSGKSSVVRAGLIPALRAGAIPGSSTWFSTTMTPGPDPFPSLEAALRRVAMNPPHSLLAQLRDGPRGILRSLRGCLGSDEDRILLVVDQFEEVFTSAADVANDFLGAMSVAVEDPASPLRLVITLRADYYHRPLEHPDFAPILDRAAVNVTPLSGDEMEQAIAEPARRAGLDFEPGLVSRIAAEATGQPSPLPLLQYTLSELFDRREGTRLTLGAYEELGGLSGAVATRAEALYETAGPGQRAATRRVFGRMTNPGAEAADLRRRVIIADFGQDPDVDWVLERYGAARLVTFDRDVSTREPTVEVAHEALLREWPRLAEWLRDDTEVLRAADAVAVAANIWVDGGRAPADLYRGGRLESAVDLTISAPDRLRPVDIEFIEASRQAVNAEHRAEQRRLRRLRHLVVAISAALVVALVTTVLAFRSQHRADQEAAAARRATTEAQAQTELAELATLFSRSAALITEDPELSILLALEAHRRFAGPETEQALLNALVSSRVANRLSTLPPPFDEAGSPCGVRMDPDGTLEHAVAGGRLITRDPLSGSVVDHGPSPEPCVRWTSDEQANRRWATSEDGLRNYFGPWQGPWDMIIESEQPMFQLASAFSANRVLFMDARGREPGAVTVKLADATTGETVGPPISGGDLVSSWAVAHDGSLMAVSFMEPNRPGGAGKTIVIDTATGDQVSHFFSEQAASSLRFDGEAGQLVAAVPFDILTVDVESGDVVSRVGTAVTPPILDIGIGDDGLVTVVSTGQVGIVDRLTGPIGVPTELPDLVFARVRPDGAIFTVDTSQTVVGVVDPTGTGLVQRAVPVNPLGTASIAGGRAAVFDPVAASTAEIIDLATGERSRVDLSDALEPAGPTGVAPNPEIVLPDSDGLWMVGSDNRLARFVGNELTEVVELSGRYLDGTRHLDRYAAVSEHLGDGQQWTATLLSLEPGNGRVLFEVPSSVPITVAIPTTEGGMHVLDAEGTLLTYNADGAELAVVDTGGQFFHAAMESSTGRLALVGLPDGVVVVDPASGAIKTVPAGEQIANLGFGRNGELLLTTSQDGTIRIWDLETTALIGVVWAGTGSVTESSYWYDETAKSIWTVSSGQLVEIPLDVEEWLERACRLVGRDFTQEEWERLVPGGGPVQSACG